MSNYLTHGEALMTRQIELGSHLVLVVDEDRHRLESMKHVLSFDALDSTVFLVDGPEGRVNITSVDEILSLHGGLEKVVILLRADPTSWTAAAVLAGMRRQTSFERIHAVVISEGTRDTLPVWITDFPGFRMMSPTRDLCSMVADISGLLDRRGGR